MSASRGPNRPVQKVKVRANGWTKVRREGFLEHLAATCNVSASVRAVGMTESGVNKLRRRDPAFAELWQQALETGYERLETAMLQRALEDVNAIVPPDGSTVDAEFDPDLAKFLLTRHRQTIEARGRILGRGAGAHIRVATEEETNAALLKQLAALRRRLADDK